MRELDNARIAIIGLGYVGLPLAVEFGKKFPTIGFDTNARRIEELMQGQDSTQEVSSDELKSCMQLEYTSSAAALKNSNTYIITVPTPIDNYKRPDLTPLIKASELVGSLVREGDVVIYESTVYPGVTEDVCVPIIEKQSGLRFNKGFFAGYSPERINPGDKEHRLTTIVKVTSGSTPQIADYVNALYGSIIAAGTHKTSSIKIAEAAKVIENTQRDLNIALINELALIFNRLGLNTIEVLEAAGSKWNFLPFRPGLVGGHCIGVDPYYLTHKAQEIGYHPEVILAGRRINDGMGTFVAESTVKLMLKKGINVARSKILILGMSFKENCPDLRNTRVVDIFAELQRYSAQVDIFDPCVNREEAIKEYQIDLIAEPKQHNYDAVILAVAHQCFLDMGIDVIQSYGKDPFVLYDVKSTLPSNKVDGQL